MLWLTSFRLSLCLRLSVSQSLRLSVFKAPLQRYEPPTNSHSRRLGRLPDHPAQQQLQTTAPSRHHITHVSPNCHLCAPPAPTHARPELPGPTRSISPHVSFACPCGLSGQHHFPFLRRDSGFPPCLPCHRHRLALAHQEHKPQTNQHQTSAQGTNDFQGQHRKYHHSSHSGSQNPSLTVLCRTRGATCSMRSAGGGTLEPPVGNQRS